MLIEELIVLPHYRIVINGNNGEVVVFSKARGKEIVLSQWLRGGYLSCKLNNKTVAVHDIIRIAKGIEKRKGYSVNHIDGNKLNNSPTNIEYITIADNIKHAVKHGLHVSSDPKRSGRYKDGRAIKSRIKEYKHEWYLRKKNKIND